MARYHLTPDGPKVCSAKFKCDYADKETGAVPEHYENKAAASKAYEVTMKGQEMPSGVTNISAKRAQKRNRDAAAEKRRDERRELQKSVTKLEGDLQSFKINKAQLENAKKIMSNAMDAEKEGRSPFFHLQDMRKVLLDSSSAAPDEKTFPYFSDDPSKVYNAITDAQERNSVMILSTQSWADEDKRKIARIEKNLTDNGFQVENPKFGVPTGESTMDVWATKQAGNYCSRPNKDVPILENSEKFCTKCGRSVTYEKTRYRWLHDNGLEECDKNEMLAHTGKPAPYAGYAQSNPECRYCGTGDPSYSTFKQQSWSDETSCSRCGGVTGYAIGD